MSLDVLLADDHVLFRQALKVLLEREGFSVRAEACDGHEAVRPGDQRLWVRPADARAESLIEI